MRSNIKDDAVILLFLLMFYHNESQNDLDSLNLIMKTRQHYSPFIKHSIVQNYDFTYLTRLKKVFVFGIMDVQQAII